MVSDGTAKRMKVIYTGRVQGVGFRFTTCRLASLFCVTGYVKNLMNGDVELVAEGTEQQLNDLLHEIKGSHLGRYISREQVRWSAAGGHYETFGILYG